MGTKAQVTLVDEAGVHSSCEQAELLADQAKRRLEDLEQRWSRFLPNSELSQINHSDGVPTVVSSETYALISAAIDAYDMTGGAFDPTIGAAMASAGYDRPLGLIDRSIEVDPNRYQAAPGPSEITLDPYTSAVQVPAGIVLDLGGIAKGAAADLVASEMCQAGAIGCLVSVGGDMAMAGTPPKSQGWQIALDCPGSVETFVIGVTSGAVCTSTRTSRTWGDDHHLRDPGSGAPLDTGLASVTVISARAIQGEILTKAVFAAGPRDGAELVANSNATGMLVLDDGTVVSLPGIEAFMAAANQPRPV